MSTSRHIDKICLAAVALSLALTVLFLCGSSLGLSAAAKRVKYEHTLFDPSYVHRIDIVMDDWDSFIERCENEEYANCTVAVDGKKHANIAIRAKGNTSLSSVKSMGSRRYSFKLEFDHNETGKTLDGLDKLCLNNLIQDNTMMKDCLAYRLMADFGADAPLCSYAYLTVNGEDWGLYLAVEGVEDSFLARNYGADPGELYKPDSMRFGGGRGNGKDFRFSDLDFDAGWDENGEQDERPRGEENRPGEFPGQPGSFPGGQLPGRPDGFPGGGQFPGRPENGAQQGSGRGGFSPEDGGPGGQGGMGSDDVKLKYIDDDPDSYPNLFGSAKTDVSAADQKRLIASLKQLGSASDPEAVLDKDELLRYFVVHNFVVNGDSYTGSMIHNYYLHEKKGKLGMIPWDYNLAFGTFQGGNAAASVNASIDEPVSGSLDDRPMVGWIFSNERDTERYHELFAEFIRRWFSNGELEALIQENAALIRPYVEKDPTRFCTVEEFDAGLAALADFVSLRAEAVRRQLAGDERAVETGELKLSDMGSMGGGREGGGPGGDVNGGPDSAPGAFTPSEGRNDQTFAPPKEQSAENAPPFGAEDRDGQTRPPDGGTEPAPGSAPQAGDAEARFWLLLGVSALVLVLGVVVAAKKA